MTNLTPQQRGERAAAALYLRKLEIDIRDFDMEGAGGKSRTYDTARTGSNGRSRSVMLPQPGPQDGPQPARVLDADGRVVAIIDPLTRERRLV